MQLANQNVYEVDYSVIIPAFNEEDLLPATLQNLEKTMETLPWKGEVVVVDNNSTDRTSEVAKSMGARVVFEPYNQISKARNTGAKEARGRYFVFLDADTLLDARLLQKSLENLDTGQCSGGGSLISFDAQGKAWGKHVVNFANGLMKKNNLAAGCYIYALREAFEGIGGFNEKIYASEEIWFSRRMNAWGKKHQKAFKVILEHSVITSSRKLENTWRLLFATLLGVFVPFSLYFRSMCFFWYKRK